MTTDDYLYTPYILVIYYLVPLDLKFKPAENICNNHDINDIPFKSARLFFRKA